MCEESNFGERCDQLLQNRIDNVRQLVDSKESLNHGHSVEVTVSTNAYGKQPTPKSNNSVSKKRTAFIVGFLKNNLHVMSNSTISGSGCSSASLSTIVPWSNCSSDYVLHEVIGNYTYFLRFYALNNF